MTTSTTPIPVEGAPIASRDSVVSVTDLVKTYPSPTGEPVRAVDGLSFSVTRGEVFGLLGPNGAGKTTTLELVEGLSVPDSGTAVVLGSDVTMSPDPVKDRIGIQLQSSAYFPELTLSELLDLFGSWYSRRLPTDELLGRVGLTDKAKARIAELSGGQAQRFSIIAGLVNDPELVLLDEPTTGLDPQARRNVWELVESIAAEGRTVVLTTHYMEEAERLAHRVAVIDAGRIQALDTPERLIASLGDTQRLTFTASRPVDHASLLTLPGVDDIVTPDDAGSAYLLCVTDPRLAIPALYDLAEREQTEVSGVQVRNPSLEDVFIELTGKQLRD